MCGCMHVVCVCVCVCVMCVCVCVFVFEIRVRERERGEGEKGEEGEYRIGSLFVHHAQGSGLILICFASVSMMYIPYSCL